MWTFSGIGRYLQDILPNLIKKMDDLDWIILVRDEDRSYFSDLGVHVRTVKSPIYSISEQLELTWKIPRCDLFWSPHYNFPVFAFQAKEMITTIHDVNHLKFSSDQSFIKIMYARLFFYLIKYRASKIITVSRFSRSEISARTSIPNDRIEVIYNPLHDQSFLSLKNLNLASEKPFFLIVGNIKPHKNLFRTLRGFLESQTARDCELRIIGDMQGLHLLPELNNLIATSSQVKLLGKVSDEELKWHYQNAKGLLFLSLYEGFGYPLVEAQLFNCPVVVSNQGALQEISSGSALEVDPYNTKEISKAIDDLYFRRWTPDTIEFQTNLKRFSHSEAINKYEVLFRKTLGDKE
jgi:glycosyltransferase involved in cell wall biosynthesis